MPFLHGRDNVKNLQKIPTVLKDKPKGMEGKVFSDSPLREIPEFIAACDTLLCVCDLLCSLSGCQKVPGMMCYLGTRRKLWPLWRGLPQKMELQCPWGSWWFPGRYVQVTGTSRTMKLRGVVSKLSMFCSIFMSQQGRKKWGLIISASFPLRKSWFLIWKWKAALKLEIVLFNLIFIKENQTLKLLKSSDQNSWIWIHETRWNLTL